MHPCLKVPEIVVSICQAIGSDWRYVHRIRDLASLALTCRSFSEAATEEIWSSPFRLEPLLFCLTEELWNEGRDYCNRRATAGLRREITVKDLEVLTRGLSRVRWQFFVIDDETDRGSERQAIEDISAAALRLNVPQPLGRVVSLQLHISALKDGAEDCLPALRVLLSSSVEHLNIYAIDKIPDSHLQYLIFADLPQRCPNLRSIRFCQDGLSLTPSSLNTYVSETSSLTVLHLQSSYPHPQLLAALKRKETLTDLSIVYLHDKLSQAELDGVRVASQDTEAPYLRRLSLAFRSIDNTIHLLRCLRPCALETIDLELSTLSNMAEARHLIRTLSAGLHHASLRCLRIGRLMGAGLGRKEIDEDVLAESECNGGDPYEFGALSVFVNLQELEIQIRTEMRIGLHAFQRLANAPPSEDSQVVPSQLKIIRIGDREFLPCPVPASRCAPPELRPAIGLCNLPVLCALFPALRELGLWVDVRGDQESRIQSPQPTPTPHRNLRRLRVAGSPINTPAQVDVARYLGACFPRLQYVGVHEYMFFWDQIPNAFYENWASVAKEMDGFILHDPSTYC